MTSLTSSGFGGGKNGQSGKNKRKFQAVLLGAKAEEQVGEETPKKSRNEGRTHDVIDNKGSAFGSPRYFQAK
jgi:hypothetical protein